MVCLEHHKLLDHADEALSARFESLTLEDYQKHFAKQPDKFDWYAAFKLCAVCGVGSAEESRKVALFVVDSSSARESSFRSHVPRTP